MTLSGLGLQKVMSMFSNDKKVSDTMLGDSQNKEYANCLKNAESCTNSWWTIAKMAVGASGTIGCVYAKTQACKSKYGRS